MSGRWLDRCRGGSRRARPAVSRVEGGRQQPQASDASPGAAAVLRRPKADRQACRDPAERGAVGSAPRRRTVHHPARRVALHVLLRRRVLRPQVQLQARRRARAETARPMGTASQEPDPRGERRLEMPRPRQHRHRPSRPDVSPLSRLSSDRLRVRRPPGTPGRGDVGRRAAGPRSTPGAALREARRRPLASLLRDRKRPSKTSSRRRK